MNSLIKISIFILTFVLSGNSIVKANEWRFDKVHSGFMFDIKHIYSTTRGQFDSFAGDIWFDPGNLDKSKFEFMIKAKSINTNNGKRDNHLKSDEFFEAGKFPFITFKSTSVKAGDGNKYTVDGKLTIKDVTKDVTLVFTYWGSKVNPFKKSEIVAGFDSRLTIDRLDYHVGNGKFYQMGVVDKDVDIIISLELLRDK